MLEKLSRLAKKLILFNELVVNIKSGWELLKKIMNEGKLVSDVYGVKSSEEGWFAVGEKDNWLGKDDWSKLWTV